MIAEYFRAKTQELLAASRLAVAPHTGLRGVHRELVVNRFLSEVLPGRFVVGTGQVLGVHHQSRQADIVLWDALNYPKLDFRGATIFFAEAVRASIEVKSRWSADELTNILEKTRALRHIVTAPQINIDDAREVMRMQIDHLAGGPPPAGIMAVQHRIGTAGFVFSGGQQFELKGVHVDTINAADECWPDLLLFLEAGIVIVKSYAARDGGELLRFDFGQDALLFFTNAFLGELIARSVYVETPLDLTSYAFPFLEKGPVERVGFPLFLLNPGRRYFYNNNDGDDDAVDP